MVLSHQTGVRFPVALPLPTFGWARPLVVALLLVACGSPAPVLSQPRETPRASGGRTLSLPPNVERLDSLGGITEYRLRSNGMKILLAPNNAAPVMTFLVVYHVGS